MDLSFTVSNQLLKEMNVLELQFQIERSCRESAEAIAVQVHLLSSPSFPFLPFPTMFLSLPSLSFPGKIYDMTSYPTPLPR